MAREFNSLEEIQKYYDEKSNTYIFAEDGAYINSVVFKFNLDVEANINAWNIKAMNINVLDVTAGNIEAMNINADDIRAKNIEAFNIDAWNINADDINSRDICVENIIAWNINAWHISYYAICVAYQNIICRSIKGRRKNAKHFVLDGTLEVEENVD